MNGSSINTAPALELERLRAKAEAAPDRAEPWKRLARAYADAGDIPRQIETMRRLAPLVRDPAGVHKEIARLLIDAGDQAGAIVHLKILVEARPQDHLSLKRLARALMAVEGPEAAAPAWRRLEGLFPGDMEAEEGLALLRRPNRTLHATADRIAILGNCQALGVSGCLRSLRPDLRVKGYIWNHIVSPASAEVIARELEGFDVVVTHQAKGAAMGALQTHVLRQRVKRLEVFPSLHWTGLHPDATRLPRGALASRAAPMGEYHSALALCSFLMGLPQGRAADLYNAYVYARLGYFEEDAKSEQFHLARGHAAGFDLRPAIAQWRRDGVFMHTPNHPTIRVMASIAGLVCERLGLERPAQSVLPSDLMAGVVWPVYPEIARRQGVAGSAAFKKGGELIDLQQMIAQSYAAYAEADPASLRTDHIDRLIETLRLEGI